MLITNPLEKKDDMMALLVLYVDEIILASNNPEKLQEIKIKFCKAFHMKDLGEPRIYLGMKETEKLKF